MFKYVFQIITFTNRNFFQKLLFPILSNRKYLIIQTPITPLCTIFFKQTHRIQIIRFLPKTTTNQQFIHLNTNIFFYRYISQFTQTHQKNIIMTRQRIPQIFNIHRNSQIPIFSLQRISPHKQTISILHLITILFLRPQPNISNLAFFNLSNLNFNIKILKNSHLFLSRNNKIWNLLRLSKFPQKTEFSLIFILIILDYFLLSNGPQILRNSFQFAILRFHTNNAKNRYLILLLSHRKRQKLHKMVIIIINFFSFSTKNNLNFINFLLFQLQIKKRITPSILILHTTTKLLPFTQNFINYPLKQHRILHIH